MLMPTVQSNSSEQPYLTIQQLYIGGFYGTECDDGIVLPNATSVSSVGWAYALIDCIAMGASVGTPSTGLALFGHGTSGQGGNFCALDNFKVIRGVFANWANGIVIDPDYIGGVLFDGVRCRGNGGFGAVFIPNSWQDASRMQCLTIVNCFFTDNLGGIAQIRIRGNTAGDLPYVIFKGNTCTLNGALDYAEFAVGTGSALASTYDQGHSFFIYGAETVITGGGTNTLGYTNGETMIENMALLKTP
jgi:hypothetical protein